MFLIFDANCSKKIAEGLDLLEQGNKRSPIHAKVKHITQMTHPAASDEEIIELVGKNKGVIVTYDKGFKTNKHRYQLYKQHNIGVILFHSYKEAVYYWDMVRSFINRWEELKTKIKEEKFPFLFEITVTKLTKLSIDRKKKTS